MNASLIKIGDLIQEAKRNKIDLGKGNPYNRLRYYTKIGWLPHMERKKEASFYPSWALKRLLLIEQLRTKNLSNSQIQRKINFLNKFQNIQYVLTSPKAQLKLGFYIGVAFVLLVIAAEIGVVNIGKPKSSLVPALNVPAAIRIRDEGNAFIPPNQNKFYVKSKLVQNTSNIYVTFNANYSPATRYWVSEKNPGEGFYIELDAPVSGISGFNWWISN